MAQAPTPTDPDPDPRTGADRDPGDAVPPGVAVEQPAPLSPEDQAVRDKLERDLRKDR